MFFLFMIYLHFPFPCTIFAIKNIKRTNMKKLFLSMILMTLPLVVSAYDVQIDGIYYNLNSSSKTAEVTYQGPDPWEDNKSAYIGAVEIPEKVTYEGVDFNVTTIGDYAFQRCSGLTSVAIPTSVVSIGVSAFNLCTSLTSVHISDLEAWCKVAFMDSYSNPLRYAHHLFLNGEEIKELVIPNTVTSIGDWAFYCCNGLYSVTIPNSVTSIGIYAFSYCEGLSSVSIPNSVTNIREWTFAYSGIKSITIPNSVTSIEGGAFYRCRDLTYVTIPNSVTTIGGDAFAFCSGLTSITLGSAVRNIEQRAFAYCNNLSSVVSKMENPCTIYYDCFLDDVFYNATLYVPKGTREDYKSTDYWSRFLHIVEGSPFEHTLSYLVDGNMYSSYTLEEGDEITPEEAPTKEGYTFSGWSEIPETMPASDVTITGLFTINKYKLTYTLDGEEYKTAEVDYGTALTAEEAPVKEGYTFSGWSEIPETMPANDVTVTGTFTANKYKLTYMVDGEEYKSSEVDYGTAITEEAVPTKEGYTFSGWSEIPSTMPAEDVTVTGTFTVNKYIITYMVDDAVLMTEEVAYGSTIAPPKSQKDGYDILWSFYPTTMPAYSITINGTYTTGINALTNEEDDRQVFTPDGKRVETPKKGLNIIRMSDGTVKKVVVK